MHKAPMWEPSAQFFDSQMSRAVFKCIEDTANGRVKNCARNAVRHLEKAFAIKDIDHEMAVLRGITGEEEAAAAILLAVRERKYENADRLNFRDHVHKRGIVPFIQSVENFFSKLAAQENSLFPKDLHFWIDQRKEKTRLKLGLRIGDDGFLHSDPPLNFKLERDGTLYTFEQEFLEITSAKNRSDVIRYIKRMVRMRNHLLYAMNEGIPMIANPVDKYLENRRENVMMLLKLLCLIFPYEEKALFVQQALNSYFSIITQIKDSVEATHQEP